MLNIDFTTKLFRGYHLIYYSTDTQAVVIGHWLIVENIKLYFLSFYANKINIFAARKSLLFENGSLKMTLKKVHHYIIGTSLTCKCLMR